MGIIFRALTLRTRRNGSIRRVQSCGSSILRSEERQRSCSDNCVPKRSLGTRGVWKRGCGTACEFDERGGKLKVNGACCSEDGATRNLLLPLRRCRDDAASRNSDNNGGTRRHFVTDSSVRAQLIAFLRSIDDASPLFP
jgi:hypothetical protein